LQALHKAMKRPLMCCLASIALCAFAQPAFTLEPPVAELAKLAGGAMRAGCKALEREATAMLAGLSHQHNEPSDEQLQAIASEILRGHDSTCADLQARLDTLQKDYPDLRQRAGEGLRRLLNQPGDSLGF